MVLLLFAAVAGDCLTLSLKESTHGIGCKFILDTHPEAASVCFLVIFSSFLL